MNVTFFPQKMVRSRAYFDVREVKPTRLPPEQSAREFMRHVDLAFDALGSRPELTALLGITPHAAESGYG